jgi:HSP20 family molecular chaperone IbpA
MKANKTLTLAICLSLLVGLVFGFLGKGMLDKKRLQEQTASVPIHKMKDSGRPFLVSNELIAPEVWRLYIDPLWTPVALPLSWKVLPDWAELPFQGPKLKTVETAREVRLEIPMPGLSEKDINVQVGKNQVAIKGQKVEEKKRGREGIQRIQESFEQIVQLPTSVDGDKGKATLKDGSLTVLLPKSEKKIAQENFRYWR